MIFDEYENEEERDLPLAFCFDVKNTALIVGRLKLLGYPRPKTPGWEAARLSIFAEAVAAYDTGRWISYSRNKNYYSHLGRYFGTAYSFARVTGSIDQAAEFKSPLLESRKVNCYSTTQSTFRATPELVNLFEDVEFEFQFHDVIRLREDPPIDEDGGKSKTTFKKGKGWTKVKKRSRLIGYADTDDTVRMRNELDIINFHLGGVKLTLPAVFDIEFDDRKRLGRFVRFDDRCVLVSQLRTYRSFCRGSFDLGGRAYGWWQQLSKELRSQILLDGEEVVEPDFSQLHATMLYALRELPVPGDAYIIPGYDRDTIKIAFNVIINARTTQAAIGAVQKELKAAALQHDKAYATQIVRAVKAAHPDIKEDFGSDKGVMLMRKDSDIIVKTMLVLVDERIPFLPVHDSVVCRKSDKDRVMQVMKDSFIEIFPGFPCKVKF